jgi:hypothetical protein
MTGTFRKTENERTNPEYLKHRRPTRLIAADRRTGEGHWGAQQSRCSNG